MNRGMWRLSCLGLLLWLGGTIAPSAIAAEFEVDPAMEQVSDVRQLRDVSPGDWAYTALQQLVNNYNCLQGYPDGTFRGDRLLSRYEFAAGLNACLERLAEFAQARGSQRGITPATADIAAIERLQREFLSELALVKPQVEQIEARVRQIEVTQFSTTTKLFGTVDYAIVTAFSDARAVSSGSPPTDEEIDGEPILVGSATLDFDTTFSGRDRLRTSIAAGNFATVRRNQTGTNMSAIGIGNSTANDFSISALFYQVPVGESGLLRFGPVGISSNSIIPTLNPIVPISRFAARNPIYRLSSGTGAVFYYQVSELLGAGVAYLSGTGNASNPDVGLFEGQFGALAQITLTPGDRFGVGLTYARYYSPEPNSTTDLTSNTGSQFAQLPFGGNTATSADAYGVQTSWRISNSTTIGGWVGYTQATAEGSPTVSGLTGSRGDDADIWNWAIAASVRDVGKAGSQLGILFGMPPRVSESDLSDREDGDTSLQLEVSYRYPLLDKLFITPGVFVIFDPEHNDANDDIWVGLVQTTLEF